MDFSDLPQAAQDRIAAAEIEADSILANSRATANEFAASADWGIDPLGINYLLGDFPPEFKLARQELRGGRDRAAGYLFGAVAGEHLKHGKLDIDGLNAKWETIGDWISQKYHTDRSVLDQLKQYCRAVALRMRAAAALSKPELAGDAGLKVEESSPAQPSTAADAGHEVTEPPAPKLNVDVIEEWIDHEGYSAADLAATLRISERTVSSIRNNGNYHGRGAVTKLANLMGRDVEDLYIH